MPDESILNPDTIAKVGNLKIRARSVVDGVLTGLHKSPHHGSSIEFAEHKEYSHGDEIRHIDWKAYARFDRYYVKKYEDETNLRCFLLVDGSASMGYGDAEGGKLDYAKTMAAAFAYLLLRQQDSPGMLSFRSNIDIYVPPRASSSHYQQLLESLVRIEAEGPPDLAASIEQTAELLSGRNLVVIFSDFFDPAPDVMSMLARLRARKNEVVLFHILHRDELELPFDSLTEFIDMESDMRLLADPDAIREEYRRVFGEFMSNLKAESQRHGIDYQETPTDKDPAKALLSFLTGREKSH